MFKFFYEKLNEKSPLVKDDTLILENITNKDIIQNGLNETCKICMEVIKLFQMIYGAAAGNVSLLTIPTGGVYLLGGLSLALEKNFLEKDTFQVSN